jgi:sugar transferase (PEP-CTERM/EpsH1 system associated)
MRILFLAFEVPYPLDRGGRIKTYHYLKALARNHEVTLVALTRTRECVTKLEHLQSALPLADTHGVHVDLSRLKKLGLALRSLVQERPFLMSLYDSADGRRLVERLMDGGRFDLVYADHLHMAQYVPAQTRAITLLDQHNVETMVLQRFADAQSWGPLRWFARVEHRMMSSYEPDMCRRFDAIWVTTEVDRALISPWLLPRQHIEALPIGVDTRYFEPRGCEREPCTLLSVGTLRWPANADGVLWFYNEALPLVKRECPDVRFVVVGADPPPAICRLADDPVVEVTGWVDDVRPYMARSTMMVVPLHGGSGMRVKILNALAMGLPVLSTSVGCEGITVTRGEDILVADDADTFAQQVIVLLRDRRLQGRLARNGVRLIQERYSWNAIYDQVEASLAAICESTSRSG